MPILHVSAAAYHHPPPSGSTSVKVQFIKYTPFHYSHPIPRALLQLKYNSSSTWHHGHSMETKAHWQLDCADSPLVLLNVILLNISDISATVDAPNEVKFVTVKHDGPQPVANQR